MIRLLLTSGRGPAECRIALGHTLDAMRDEAVAAGLDLDAAAGPARDRHGPASVLVMVHAESVDTAAAFARRWTGSILGIAPSPVRPHHTRKNWFVGVVALPARPDASRPDASRPDAIQQIAAADVTFEAFRAGGAGGQHQNKTESAVRAVHGPSGFTVVVRTERSAQIAQEPRWGGGPTRGDALMRDRWDSFDLDTSRTIALRETLDRALLAHGLENPVLVLSLPDRQAFRDALVSGIRRTLAGGTKGDDSLKDVGRQWKGIIEKRGAAAHRRDYRLGLGLLGE